jgi:hypothetical protein
VTRCSPPLQLFGSPMPATRTRCCAPIPVTHAPPAGLPPAPRHPPFCPGRLRSLLSPARRTEPRARAWESRSARVGRSPFGLAPLRAPPSRWSSRAPPPGARHRLPRDPTEPAPPSPNGRASALRAPSLHQLSRAAPRALSLRPPRAAAALEPARAVPRRVCGRRLRALRQCPWRGDRGREPVEIRMGSEKGDAAGGKKISARGRNKTEREEQRRRRRG